MKVLYFDCFSGISGDMTVASLLDLGVDQEKLLDELSKLGLEGYSINVEKKLKMGISGTYFNVILDQNHQDDHHHHEHCHEHQHRNLKDIEDIIDSSSLSDKVKALSKKIFRIVAEAEGKIHGVAPEEVHFHEVGAVDSIVDIVATAICIEELKPDKIVFSKLPLSRGFVKCQHGVFPLPAPAALEILKDIPVYFTDAPIELVTPTGAAIAKALGDEYGDIDEMSIERVGYGIGTKDYHIPNVLRTIIFDVKKNDHDKVVLLETNIDDMTGEALGFAMERLFEAGALDVYFTPITMKKNRPGIILSTLCKLEDVDRIKKLIFLNTTTFGIREQIIQRDTLDRDFIKVEVLGEYIRCKVGTFENRVIKCSPEYEDCKAVALKTSADFSFVYNQAIAKSREYSVFF